MAKSTNIIDTIDVQLVWANVFSQVFLDAIGTIEDLSDIEAAFEAERMADRAVQAIHASNYRIKGCETSK